MISEGTLASEGSSGMIVYLNIWSEDESRSLLSIVRSNFYWYQPRVDDLGLMLILRGTLQMILRLKAWCS